MGDHTESIQITYDPAGISYKELLAIFWKDHAPYSQSWSKQYMNVAFYEDEKQHEAIKEFFDTNKREGKEVKTRIAHLDSFYPAEDYHQKHSLRGYRDFMAELTKKDISGRWLYDSTAVTKINGYLGGYGTCDQLEKEVRGFDLSTELEEKLLKIVCSKEGRVGVACPISQK
jgi:hypothetical protein